MNARRQKKMTKLIALLLVVVTVASPCLMISYYIREDHINNEQFISASATKKKLPIYCVNTQGKKQVAITFDAAWGDEDAQRIRETLKQYNVKATFFMVGDWMRKYPELVKQLAEDGHDMANHSNKHPHVNQMSEEAIKQDILAAHDEIKRLTGQECYLYRPPYGEYNNTVLDAAQACHYYTIQWDVDSLDWKGYDAPTLVNKVVNHKHLGDGSIILLHNGAKHTAEALPQIIEGLKQKGYELVPVSQLIYKDNYELDHEGRQQPH